MIKKVKLIKGLGASPGIAVGKACILLEPKDVEGVILVTESTDPRWTPVITKCKGIVTNTGGMLCHAAIVARELGIPAVVGTRNATDILEDGEIIEVDGNKGEVHVIATNSK